MKRVAQCMSLDRRDSVCKYSTLGMLSLLYETKSMFIHGVCRVANDLLKPAKRLSSGAAVPHGTQPTDTE